MIIWCLIISSPFHKLSHNQPYMNDGHLLAVEVAQRPGHYLCTSSASLTQHDCWGALWFSMPRAITGCKMVGHMSWDVLDILLTSIATYFLYNCLYYLLSYISYFLSLSPLYNYNYLTFPCNLNWPHWPYYDAIDAASVLPACCLLLVRWKYLIMIPWYSIITI